MILITKDYDLQHDKGVKLKQELLIDHVVIVGKNSKVYPKMKVLSIHKRTPENIVAHALGLKLN